MRREDAPEQYEAERFQIGRMLIESLLRGPESYAQASEAGRRFRLRWEEPLPGDEEEDE